MPLSLEVTFAAYLAVLLGTFVPVTFLIVLYSQVRPRIQFRMARNKTNFQNTFQTQSEARRAGIREGKTK